ncbi:MAG: hypothetical protein R2710_22710 [Acidimicrobiales bacterium]
MSRRIAGRVSRMSLASVPGLVVGGPGIVAGRGDQASATVTIDPATELRVRALADAATLPECLASGVMGCSGARDSSSVTPRTRTVIWSRAARRSIRSGSRPIVQPISALAADLDVATAPAVSAVRLEFAEHNPAIGSIVFVAGHAGGNETEVLQGTVHLYGMERHGASMATSCSSMSKPCPGSRGPGARRRRSRRRHAPRHGADHRADDRHSGRGSANMVGNRPGGDA